MEIKFENIFHFALNVIDMDRSFEYYQSLGFKVLHDFILDGETVLSACAATRGAAP